MTVDDSSDRRDMPIAAPAATRASPQTTYSTSFTVYPPKGLEFNRAFPLLGNRAGTRQRKVLPGAASRAIEASFSSDARPLLLRTRTETECGATPTDLTAIAMRETEQSPSAGARATTRKERPVQSR